MINRLALVVLMFFGAASHAQAQAPASAAARVSQPLNRTAFLATMDAEYRSIDANRDQALSQVELETHQRSVVAASAARRARAAFATIDTDRNGQVSVDEYIKSTARPAAVDGRAIMARLDANRDQKVSVVEYRILTLANFDRIDADRDGNLTAAEQRASGIAK